MSKVTAINIIIKKKNQLRKLKKEYVSSIYIDTILMWLNDIQKKVRELNMTSNEDHFKKFPKISKLAKVLSKIAITSDPTLRQWKRTSLPSIPIKEIYIGNRAYEVNNGFTKRRKYDKRRS